VTVTGGDLRTARHEALHAVGALWHGRKLRSVLRMRDSGGACGMTFSAPGGSADVLALAVVLVLPSLDLPDLHGCSSDLRALGRLVDAGVPVELIVTAAEGCLADPKFRRQVRIVEHALWSRPALSGAEVEELLQ
jgi:hypothetical protein